ncbi:MAG: T9SS type A sorting domain-containing protein [Bacteroidales bacterium]|nr:T9SS type A sorting domain-containing protein [Bacteroidales bacterium]
MKKAILLLGTSLLIAFSLYSQNLSLSTEAGNLAPNEVVYMHSEPTGGLLVSHVYVTNNGTEALSVKVKKIENYLVEGAFTSICWGGNCFPPEVYVSPTSEIIGPGETNMNGFSGDFSDSNVAGLSSISYVFFVENHPDDSVMVVFNYDITAAPRSLSLSDVDGNIPANGTVVVGGPPDEELKAKVFVTNNSLDTVNIIVRRIVNYAVPGSVNQFCWGLCYPPGVNQSTVVVPIDPGAVNNTDFEGDYNPGGNSGVSRITYVFINADDSTDFTALTINFDIEVTGVSESILSSLALSDAYPNPADDYVNFNYSIKPDYKITLAIFNLLGSKVMEKDLDVYKSKVSFYTGGLDEGIYFYSVMAGNDILKTQKLIVKH